MGQLPLFSADPQTPEEIAADTPLKATLGHFAAHLKHEGKTQHTITSFLSDLKLMGGYLGMERPVGGLLTGDLEDFLYWLEFERTDNDGRPIPCSRKSYARRVTSLKVFFKWLKALGAIKHDPAGAVRQRSGPAPLSQALSLPQIRACIEAARTFKKGGTQDYRPEMLFRLLVDTGLKKSEVMRLKPIHIDRTNPHLPVLHVRQKVRNVFKERRIDLDPDWVRLFDLYRAQYPPKPNTEIIVTCTARNLEYILKDIGQAAGLDGEQIPPENRIKLSFEVLRWTCAVKDHRMGMDEQSLREKLGLSEPSWYETSNKIKQLAEQLAADSAAS
ncbi:MAG: hypothetical protein EA396_14655 [Anaerolineaceae bacterium]|nr:MAG: hypothetical protein EA396_14655 [Anaerolineaceae bacterium]